MQLRLMIRTEEVDGTGSKKEEKERIQLSSGSCQEVMKNSQTKSVAVYPVRRQCPRFQASGYTEAE